MGTSMINASSKDKEIQKAYCVSLVKLGKRSSSHIYELSDDFLSSRLSSPEARFLVKAKAYFGHLELFEKKIVVMNILERGAYYPFWYLPEIPYSEFRDKKLALENTLARFATEEGVLL